jgi:hypothetical protein
MKACLHFRDDPMFQRIRYTLRSMSSVHRARRLVAVIALLFASAFLLLSHPDLYEAKSNSVPSAASTTALKDLETLPVKGRAPKTGYARTEFGNGWATVNGCDTRNLILYRDLINVAVDQECKVLSGTLNDPYTGKTIIFQRGNSTSSLVQIDHVVALSNAWQTGAQQLPRERREALANDPLELLAVDGKANQDKSDGDAATWLPPNKIFRCQYVTRQINVKKKYSLWVTSPEKEAMKRVLSVCL